MNEQLSEKIRDEAVRHLQALIRFDTSNPPGNETPAAEYVASVLADEGIETRVLEVAPGRASAVARLHGSGEQPPLLLMAHLDVVPAQPRDWRHPPFAGELAEGYVWGRGAVDTKNATAIQMAALLTIARLGVPLKRDLLLAAMADEEVGGQGAQFLARHHPEWVTAEYALNEGGGDAFVMNGRRFYSFQVAQKGGGNIKMVARGTAGHSSVPYPDSAVSTLAAAIVRLKKHPLPHRVIGTTTRFFQGMADAVGDERLAQHLRAMLDPERQKMAVQQLGLDDYMTRLFDAMLRDVSETTMLKAGLKSNVMPAEAEATISARGLPGVSEGEWLQEIRDVVGDTVELHPGRFAPGLEFDLPDDDPLFGAARWAISRRDEDATLLPYLSCGGTDAMYLAPVGTKVIGFTPMRPDPAGYLLELAHAKDERITVDNLLFGTQVLVDTICHLNDVESPLPLG